MKKYRLDTLAPNNNDKRNKHVFLIEINAIYVLGHEEFPTLLHFAAKFGLEKLAMQLLECPGAEVAYEYRNIYDMTPLELAEANGFSDLAIMFRGFMVR